MSGWLPDSDWSALLVDVHPRVNKNIKGDRTTRPPVLACGDGYSADSALAIPAWRLDDWMWTIISPEDLWAIHWPWFVAANGYAVRNYMGKQQYLHRLVCWCRHERKVEPAPIIWMSSAIVVDHGDRDRLNNRRSNLTMTTSLMNRINHDDGVFPGVSWDSEREKWLARTSHKGKDVWVGRFHSPHQARRAIERMRTKLDREAAREAAKAVSGHCTGELLTELVPF